MKWRDEQINQMLEQCLDYAEDWNECLGMLDEIDLDKDTQTVHGFLECLVVRLKNMRRRFNIVTYNAKTKTYTISNYDFKTYKWFKACKFSTGVITSRNLHVHTNDLSSKQRDYLNKLLEV